MKPRPALFLAAHEDNVAVALDNLHAGQRVPLLSSEGQQKAEITLWADVPMFFKVSVRDLVDGEAIIKHGHRIGTVVARIFLPDSSTGGSAESTVVLPPGSPVHLTNFVCSSELAALWDDHLAKAFGVCFALCRPDFEFGTAAKKIAAGQEIRRDHIRVNSRVGEILKGLDGSDPIVGRAIVSIAEGSLVRLGCVTPSEYRYPGDPEMIEDISRFYRFLRARIYANS
jgi:hypothetical protein